MALVPHLPEARMRRSLSSALWLTAALAACAPGEPAVSGVTITDSAGVRITVSAPVPGTWARVDTVPVLSLGGADVTGPTLFSNTRGVLLDRRGRLWVADGQSGELRIFGPDGSFVKSVGRRGEGPGEFVGIRLLGAFRGDSVAVWDDAQGRLTILDPEGGLARMVTATTDEGPAPNAFRVFPDGTVLARVRTVLQAGTLEPGTIIPDTAVFARVDYTSMRTEGHGGAPAPRWLWTGRRSLPLPFALNPGFDLFGDDVHTTSGPAFRIRVFRAGELVESYGVDRDPVPVTEADRREYAETVLGVSDNATRSAEAASVLAHPEVPTLLPAYRTLVIADTGETWAERYEYGVFDVYGRDRALLGRVDVPLALTQVVGSLLIGIWRDDLGVEHVRTYRFRRVGPSAG
jgi:hypothetical protein